MSFITTIANRAVQSASDELDGKVLTRPALLLTDGDSLLYVVDVDIGNDAGTLKNVPISRANREVCYAEVGNPCRLRRTTGGQWEVVGFSQEMPGTYTRFPVDLGNLSYGVLEDITIDARPLTYEELSTVGTGYGSTPYGAIAIFRGGVLQEIK